MTYYVYNGRLNALRTAFEMFLLAIFPCGLVTLNLSDNKDDKVVFFTNKKILHQFEELQAKKPKDETKI